MKNNNFRIFGSWKFFRRFKKKKPKFQLFVCFLIIMILHIIGFQRIFDNAKFCVTSAEIYINRTINNACGKLLNFWYFISYDIDKTILKLHKENIKLLTEIENLNHLKFENEELRKLLSMKNVLNQNVIVAKVINVFSNDYARSCLLDVGADDGIAVDDIVRNQDGLVGRISEVSTDWSRVLLITDTNSNIPIKIGNEHINAIAAGDNSNVIRISIKHEDIDIKNNDIAETSGFGNVFCEKIPVGKIIEKNKIFSIIPYVNFNSLNYVSILKKK